jgi:rhamnosyl/mannosyltransferase
MKMRIMHLYKDYFPVEGGIENHVRWLAEAQAARGHDVSVLVTSRTAQTHIETMNGVRVIFASRLASVSSAPVSLALFSLLARERPDVLHLQFPYPWGELAALFFGHARKTVMTYQSDIVRQRYLRLVYAPFMERVLARMDTIIATSPNYIETSPVLSRWKEKTIAVPMGIDPSPFAATPVTRGPRLDDTFNLLFVGALRYYKGLNYLLQALPQIPKARLVVIGTGMMEREWKDLARQLDLTDRVEFVGEVANPDLPPYYAACDVFVLPCSERSEAFGLVQLEAMASGKPVVSCDVGTGVAFVNQDQVTGLVVQPKNPLALTNAVNRLAGDRALRELMGAAGRARVAAEFTLDRMVERIMGVYQS